jgi:hypothetical protein
MKTRNTIVTLALLVLFAGGLFAQEPRRKSSRGLGGPDGPRFPGQEGPDGKGRPPGPPKPREGRPFGPPPPDSFRFLSPEGRFGGKTVKGAPYSAVTETETIQMLADGGRIVRKTEAHVYRDSEGRTRREQTLHNIGPFAASSETGDAPRIISIHDPAAGVNYFLDPRNRTARKMTFRGGPPPPPRPAQSSEDVKTESLGTQTIEGVEAEGTRSTTVIPVGRIGNERPIEIVTERWYAPALQETVLIKHRDPRVGEHSYRLRDINRAEPARTLFEVPADYSVSEGRSFDDRGRSPKRRPDDDR